MEWFIGHLVGDFVLQNDFLAINKKKSTTVCLIHVALYNFVLIVSVALSVKFAGTPPWPLWAWVVVTVTHFAQDRTNIVQWFMQAIGQRKFAQPPMSPWSVIVVDQVLHLVVLYGLSLAAAARTA